MYPNYVDVPPQNNSSKMTETLESVFQGLPDGCILKTPTQYTTKYVCVYKERSHTRQVKAFGDTPREAVIKLADLLAKEGIAS